MKYPFKRPIRTFRHYRHPRRLIHSFYQALRHFRPFMSLIASNNHPVSDFSPCSRCQYSLPCSRPQPTPAKPAPPIHWAKPLPESQSRPFSSRPVAHNGTSPPFRIDWTWNPFPLPPGTPPSGPQSAPARKPTCPARQSRDRRCPPQGLDATPGCHRAGQHDNGYPPRGGTTAHRRSAPRRRRPPPYPTLVRRGIRVSANFSRMQSPLHHTCHAATPVWSPP